MIRWFIRKTFWNLLAWIKFSGNRPVDIPLPPITRGVIHPVPLREAIPGIPIGAIMTCHPGQIPADERSLLHSLFYKLQVWLYTAYPPMQAGLPDIDADPEAALKKAFTRLHRTRFDAPPLPAEFLGSPDLGSLAVRGPYACYLEKGEDDTYKWDLRALGKYEHHDGLQTLGAVVRFRHDRLRRALQAVRIDTALGSAGPLDPLWDRAKKIALCSASTHLSLVRHFNWVHLVAGAHLAIATRNHLAREHPLCRLLWPHMYGTAANGDVVTRGQMVRGGDFESTFSLSFEGMCRLFEESYSAFRIVVCDPEQDATARQIRGAGFDTPTQDNLEALFNVIHEHARRYLLIYYPATTPDSSSTALRQDVQILAWLDELNVLIPNGAGVTRDTVTFDNLARLIARFIYMVSAEHEILGGFMWNYQLWTHRQPVRIYPQAGRREPLDVYQRLVNANYNLNVTRRELMFDFSYLALDAGGAAAMAQFDQELKWLQLAMEKQPWAVWKLYPHALKANINA